ncbi:LL-diaminopimelate aminotransferase [Halalkalibacter urbisdiaboli]|uniref:LL-diaminopimelate aminotransferase n=1 Tax=Halalkalibacter urbisdiaboli TaxID=1960589 RepID=UPI000B43805C|nr:LL-diaminopimelate aminotransferase [Halalkalibacter urbisdiaboli]
MKPSKRLKHLATSVFTEMAERKAQKLASGQQLIDLSIGSPDLPPPAFIKDALMKAVADDTQYGYAITSQLQFREAVCTFYKRRYQVELDEQEVLQLLGSQDGLSHLPLAYLDEGDVLLAPNPGYPIYAASAELAGAELFAYPLNIENQFMFDVDSLPDDIKKRAKLMIVNYPGNPTAAMATKEYYQTLINFGIKHDILIVSDFAYSELVFNDRQPLSILSLPNAKKTAIELNSLSKSFNLAGARIGYALGDPKFLKPLATIKSHIDYGMFHPIQAAAIAAFESDGSFLKEHNSLYEGRKNTFISALAKIGWDVRSPDGGMFIWAKIPEGYTSMEFTLKALDHGVVVTPGHAFGTEGEGYIRLALVQDHAQLIEAATKLKPLFQ